MRPPPSLPPQATLVPRGDGSLHFGSFGLPGPIVSLVFDLQSEGAMANPGLYEVRLVTDQAATPGRLFLRPDGTAHAAFFSSEASGTSARVETPDGRVLATLLLP